MRTKRQPKDWAEFYGTPGKPSVSVATSQRKARRKKAKQYASVGDMLDANRETLKARRKAKRVAAVQRAQAKLPPVDTKPDKSWQKMAGDMVVYGD